MPTETDVLIIGGGISGLVSAYLLARAKKRVIILEKGRMGEWVTDCTTGFLTGVIDTDPAKLIKVFGLDQAGLILASHEEAIAGIEKIINSEHIDCEFTRCTNYIYANSEREEGTLIKMGEAYRQLGISAEFKKENKLKFSKFGYLEMPNQAKFHVMKYLAALARLACNYGAIIAEDTEVLNLADNGETVEVTVKDVGTIKVKKVVSATYDPFEQPKRLSHLINMYRSYVVEYKIPTGALALGTYQDNLQPYHYFRVDSKKDFDRLVIGGADHLDVIKMDRTINYRTIREYATKLFADIKLDEVRYWSGLILETNDGLAFIGETDSKNIFYIFGFSGNGMTYSYIAGKILLDEVLSVKNPYSEVYKINRKIAWWKKLS